MGTTTTKKNDDDAMRIHNEELKANVAKMDAFLDAMEKAIVNANHRHGNQKRVEIKRRQ